jgi:hypothetical protein
MMMIITGEQPIGGAAAGLRVTAGQFFVRRREDLKILARVFVYSDSHFTRVTTLFGRC